MQSVHQQQEPVFVCNIPFWVVDISFLRTNSSSSSKSSSWVLPLADFIISMKLWLFCADDLFDRITRQSYHNEHEQNTNLQRRKKRKRLTETKRESWSCFDGYYSTTVTAAPTSSTALPSPPLLLTAKKCKSKLYFFLSIAFLLVNIFPFCFSHSLRFTTSAYRNWASGTGSEIYNWAGILKNRPM